MADSIQQFRAAIVAAGLTPSDTIEADGKLHRFASNGKHGDDAGWYVYHANGIAAGAFGCWRSGLQSTWCTKSEHELTNGERQAMRERVKSMQRQREAEQAQRQAEAKEKAAVRLAKSEPAAVHPYLTTKGIAPHGARSDGQCLVIPMRDTAGILHSLQTIDADGDKRFLTGGRVTGCYFPLGKPDGVLCIAEGFATGASIHEATGYGVAVAFDSGNLMPVARALRKKFPTLRLVLCADDDYRTEGNSGITKATEAARAIGGLLAVPDFGPNRPDGVTDFNDLAQARGLEAVKQAIAKASAPAMAEHQLRQGNATTDAVSGRISYRRASDIQAKPIRWLWPGRMARGKVSILAGNPGLGKSQITASMAAIVSTGGTWTVDKTRCELGNVVILSAEDDPEDTIRPRLEAVGADLSRVFILDAVVEGYRGDGGETKRAFNLKTDLARLGAMLEEIGGAALIIIDPITAYLGDTDSHRNSEVRALLSPLSDLAAKYGTAVVCVSHFNKATGGEALMRITGSLAFVAAARAAFIVTKDPDNEARRLFLPLKNNIGNDQTGLAFAVQSAQVQSPAGLIETSRVVWEAEAVTVTADEAMIPQGDPEERSAVDDAKEFLAGLLADGPMPAKRVYGEARDAGHSERTIRRAQKALGVEAIKEGLKGSWLWKLPVKMANKAEDGHTNCVDAFGNLGHLQQPLGDETGQVEVEPDTDNAEYF